MNEFKSKLGDLLVNKKCIIHELTDLAKAYEDNAEVIVSEIQSHIAEMHPDAKLPGLYLIDSIIKNVKGRYLDLFRQFIVQIFSDIFQEVDVDTRRKMYKLRKRWTHIFPDDLLFKLDLKINCLLADWPIAVEIAPSKKLLSLKFQKQELELKLATTEQLIAKLDHQSDAEMEEESTYVVTPQLTMPFGFLNDKRPAGETSFEKSDLKKIKSDCDECHDDDVIEIIEKRDTIEILDDEMTELNVSSSDTNSSASLSTLTNNQGHVENTRKRLHNSIVGIEGLEEQSIDSTTNDTYEVFPHLLKIKNESNDLTYGDDDDCFDDIGSSTVSFTDEIFSIDNHDLQSLKPTQETPISNHQSQTDPSTFTTIDGNLQFPDIATSIGANKIKINLKNNVACIKPERKKYSKTNSCKTKKIVVRSKVQADEKSALCNMM